MAQWLSVAQWGATAPQRARPPDLVPKRKLVGKGPGVSPPVKSEAPRRKLVGKGPGVFPDARPEVAVQADTKAAVAAAASADAEAAVRAADEAADRAATPVAAQEPLQAATPAASEGRHGSPLGGAAPAPAPAVALGNEPSGRRSSFGEALLAAEVAAAAGHAAGHDWKAAPDRPCKRPRSSFGEALCAAQRTIARMHVEVSFSPRAPTRSLESLPEATDPTTCKEGYGEQSPQHSQEKSRCAPSGSPRAQTRITAKSSSEMSAKDVPCSNALRQSVMQVCYV